MKIVKLFWLLLPAVMLSINSFSQNIFKIQANTTLDLNGGVVFTLQDLTLDNDGTLSPAVGAGRVIFKGAANDIIRGNGTTNFDQLEIAKTGNGTLTLQTDLDIRSGIWFNGGLINLDNSVVTLLGNASLNDESETSRVIATNGGYLQVNMQLNAPKGINPGNLGAIISSTQNLGLTLIRRGHEQQTVEAGRTSIQRYFDITPQNNTALNATFRMEYADGELEKQAENALEFRLSEDLTKWVRLTSSSRNTTDNYVELQGLNSFGRLTLADDGAGLPVIFSFFTVTCGNNATLVSWATASEQNASHFEVQRSANGNAWTTIATLPASGNSNTEKRYSYTDQQPQGKFYRIREIDLDSRSQYSLVGVADCESGNNFKVWPNPVQEQLFVTIKAERRGVATIQIYNSAGKLVKKQNSGLLPGNNQLSVNMQALPGGYYHVEVVWNDGMRKAISLLKK